MLQAELVVHGLGFDTGVCCSLVVLIGISPPLIVLDILQNP